MINKIRKSLSKQGSRNHLQRTIEEYLSLKSNIKLLDVQWQCTFAKLFNMTESKKMMKANAFNSFFEYFYFENTRKEFGLIINDIKSIKSINSKQVSFTSKMLNILNNSPIYDSRVENALTIFFRISFPDDLVDRYIEVVKWYNNTQYQNDRNDLINEFDSQFPKYANCISDVKKIDFMLWVAGK